MKQFVFLTQLAGLHLTLLVKIKLFLLLTPQALPLLALKAKLLNSNYIVTTHIKGSRKASFNVDLHSGALYKRYTRGNKRGANGTTKH